MNDEKDTLPLASEMYADLKDSNRFLRKLLIAAFVVILVLIAALCGTHIYHIHQWSLFETVVVDSEQGPANYVQGDNTGGIYNGEGFSSQKENGTVEGSQDQKDQHT